MRAADVESDLQEHPHLEIKPKFLSKRDSLLLIVKNRRSVPISFIISNLYGSDKSMKVRLFSANGYSM